MSPALQFVAEAAPRKQRAKGVAFLVNRSPRDDTGSESSARALGVDAQRTSGAHPCTARGETRDDGHSYDGTVVRGGIGGDRHDDSIAL